MSTSKPQTYENHARFVVAYHGIAFGILVLNFIWSIYRVATSFGIESLMGLLLCVALLLVFFYARLFALTVQDRVIRLEMRLRLAGVLPPDLRSEIDRFTVDQLVAMRFASDEEMPALARRVLADNLTDRKAIKKLVKNWQADYLRA
jgi:hypothetical protein